MSDIEWSMMWAFVDRQISYYRCHFAELRLERDEIDRWADDGGNEPRS